MRHGGCPLPGGAARARQRRVAPQRQPTRHATCALPRCSPQRAARLIGAQCSPRSSGRAGEGEGQNWGRWRSARPCQARVALDMALGWLRLVQARLHGTPTISLPSPRPFPSPCSRWDAWARLTQPLLARLPLVSCRGNHEIEQLLEAQNATSTAANARYPYPQARCQGAGAGGELACAGAWQRLRQARPFVLLAAPPPPLALAVPLSPPALRGAGPGTHCHPAQHRRLVPGPAGHRRGGRRPWPGVS